MSDSPPVDARRVNPALVQQFEQQGTVYTKPKPGDLDERVSGAHHRTGKPLTGSESSETFVQRALSKQPSDTDTVDETGDGGDAEETEQLVEKKERKDTDEAQRLGDVNAAGGTEEEEEEELDQPKEETCCQRVTNFFCGCFFSKPKQS